MSALNKINVFSQTKTKRDLVGTLWKEKNSYHFQYNNDYARQKKAIPLGPEFELWKENFSSQTLFASLLDRIPSKENPAYIEYCQQWGIDPDEKDFFILLTTIGRRGPSTFIFEAAMGNAYNSESVKKFRENSGLSQREFGLLLGLAHVTLIRLEQGKSKNETLLLYIQMVENTPGALKWLLKKRGQYLHDNAVARLSKIKKN